MDARSALLWPELEEELLGVLVLTRFGRCQHPPVGVTNAEFDHDVCASPEKVLEEELPRGGEQGGQFDSVPAGRTLRLGIPDLEAHLRLVVLERRADERRAVGGTEPCVYGKRQIFQGP